MTWLQIVFFILFNIPKFIGIIAQILDIVKQLPKDQKLSIKDMIIAAIEHYKQTGNTDQLEQVCSGVGCPPKIKKD